MQDSEPTQSRPRFSWWLLAALGCAALAGPLVLVLDSVFHVFSSAESAKIRTLCQSNLRALAHAQLAYAADYDDRLCLTEHWMDSTSRYLSSAARQPSVWHCPSVAADAGGYAMSRSLAGRIVSQIDNPREEVLLFETAVTGRNISGGNEIELDAARINHADRICIATVNGKAWFKRP